MCLCMNIGVYKVRGGGKVKNQSHLVRQRWRHLWCHKVVRHLMWPASVARRRFTTSRRLSTHYDTLSIPRNASRAQIKSAFYKLSKELHPDTHPNDPQAKEKYVKVSGAYSVLGNDRQRRIYDRTLEQPSHQHHSYHYQSPYHDPHSAYEYRRPSQSAKHAWNSKHTARGHSWSYTYTYTHSDPKTHKAHSEDPFSSPYVRRATGKRPSASQERQHDENDKIVRESSLIRFIQVASILTFVMFLSGGGVART